MKRKLLIAGLGLGTFLGFASGFASLGACWQHRAEHRRAAFEAHVADVCVEAARRAEPRGNDWGEAPPSDYPDEAPPRRHRRHHRHAW
ncbi:MAG: hypothetical protein KF729_26940 [Sandaracinaceae bacterium]|nr:hypothetical protein [Sandaracinaceae bacterium]